ncbi:cAMP-dependent protein kinase catalytic subunit [Entomophthora muscae]|uniref:cAMP-dependent protein kinase catalytic subunit n=1 Tax=Entomophthora muscae TaxID=34485 RepID=A0ACC2UCK1_9FUNG|nr:cAMP-dependent protein kinase catalytic subunit [Entomophthora muscae]
MHNIGDTISQQLESGVVSRYTIMRVLGQGVCGPVFQIQGPGGDYALKTIPKPRKGEASEADYLMMLESSPNIVNLAFVIEEEQHLLLAMELCTDDLYSLITAPHSPFSFGNPSMEESHNQAVRATFMKVLDAVEQCHANGIFHRDLKPENILFAEDGGVRLADFGLSTTRTVSYQLGCGSVYYMAPEVISKGQCSSYAPAKADMWALGIIFLNICTGQNPWESASPTHNNFREYQKNPKILGRLFPLSSEGLRIAQALLSVDPILRPSIAQTKDMVKVATNFIGSRSTPPTSSDEFSDSMQTESIGSSSTLQSKESANKKHSPETSYTELNQPKPSPNPKPSPGCLGFLCFGSLFKSHKV